MPYPERIRDINDYLIRSIKNQRVKLIIVSPERKCNINTKIDDLAQSVAEATILTSERIIETGEFKESSVLPFTFVTKEKVNEFDNVLAEIKHD